MRRLTSLALFGVTAGLASSAAAQSDADRAAARSAAEAGDSAFKAGHYKEAADYFERAERIMHAPTLLLYQARSYVQLGRYVKAREAYIRVTREVLDANAPQAFRTAQEAARQELPQIENKIARITINVDPQVESTLNVVIDGAKVPSAVVGLPYPVDPGAHKIEVSAEGYEPASADVAVKEMESKPVILHLVESAKPAVTSPPSVTSGGDPPPPGGDTGTTQPNTGMRIGAYIGFGVGAVGVGLGTLFLVQRIKKLDDADSAYQTCNSGRGGCDGDEEAHVKDLDNQAATKGTVSLISFAAGAAGVATGITLLVLGGAKHSPEQAVVQPYFTGTGGGVFGRF